MGTDSLIALLEHLILPDGLDGLRATHNMAIRQAQDLIRQHTAAPDVYASGSLIQKLEEQRDLGGHVPLVWRNAMQQAIDITQQHAATPDVVERVAAALEDTIDWNTPDFYRDLAKAAITAMQGVKPVESGPLVKGDNLAPTNNKCTACSDYGGLCPICQEKRREISELMLAGIESIIRRHAVRWILDKENPITDYIFARAEEMAKDILIAYPANSMEPVSVSKCALAIIPTLDSLKNQITGTTIGGEMWASERYRLVKAVLDAAGVKYEQY